MCHAERVPDGARRDVCVTQVKVQAEMAKRLAEQERGAAEAKRQFEEAAAAAAKKIKSLEAEVARLKREVKEAADKAAAEMKEKMEKKMEEMRK
eukprot:5157844-Pyramimonas_sp.AAC.1